MESQEEYIDGFAGPFLFRRRPGAHGLYATSKRIVLISYEGKMLRSYLLVIAATLTWLTAVLAIIWFFFDLASFLPVLLLPSIFPIFYITARNTRPRYVGSLEELSEARGELEIRAEDIRSIKLEKPSTLSGTGTIAITTTSGGRIALQVAGGRAFVSIKMVLRNFCSRTASISLIET